jgi:DNA-binding NtrC family response regulator
LFLTRACVAEEPSQDAPLSPLTEESQALSPNAMQLLHRISEMFDFASDTDAFLHNFCRLLHELFGPERIVIAMGDTLHVEGGEEDDPLAELILYQARYQMKALAFSPVEEADCKEHVLRISAMYVPVLIDQLLQGYVYLLAPEGDDWNQPAFSLFALLGKLASRGLTGFQVLQRAQEDREVLHLNLVGIAPEMQRLKTELLRVSQHDEPVLIEGEDGVGKSRIARAIHQSSARRQAPILVLNAAQFPTELFEMELCGSIGEVGGILRTKAGKLDMAEGGSFLIEEIGELPLGVQPMLVALLKSGKYMRVGGEEPRSANVRILFTTTTPIRELINQERLIPELEQVLHPNTLQVPSLRQRKEDIPQLFRSFLGRFGEDEGLPTCVVSEEALEHLKNHRWRYNIRELRDIVARCFYEVDPVHPIVDEPVIIRVLEAHTASQQIVREDVLGKKVRELEHRMIQEALMAANDDLQEAAKALGISRVVLWRKMRSLAIG